MKHAWHRVTGTASTVGVLVLVSCSQELPAPGYLLLHIDTDAPLPRAAAANSEYAASDPLIVDFSAGAPALFDKLEIEVEGGPPPTTLDVTADMFESDGISFAIQPDKDWIDQRIVVNVTLFRGIHRHSRTPVEVTDLTRCVSLPPASEWGETEAWVFLATDNTGVSSSPNELDRPWQKTRVNTWEPALPKPCEIEPNADEVCVHGGAFWMGDPELSAERTSGDSVEVSDLEHVVALDPFILDAHETSVAALEQEMAALRPDHPNGLWSANPSVNACNDAPMPDPDLPVSGVSWSLAQAYCSMRGKTLPTEAQFEYVASGLGREWTYPWGAAEPLWTDAILERNGTCPPTPGFGGPSHAGSGERDRVTIRDARGDERTVTDLGGNLSEWVLDAWRDQPDVTRAATLSCVLRNPQVTSQASRRAFKGGSWESDATRARAGARNRFNADRLDPTMGFRCARQGTMQAPVARNCCGPDEC